MMGAPPQRAAACCGRPPPIAAAICWCSCSRMRRTIRLCSLRGFERSAGNLLTGALRYVDPGARVIVLCKRSGARIGAEEAIIQASAGDAIALLVLVGRLLRVYLSGGGGGKKGQHCGRNYGRTRLINRRFHDGISLHVGVAGFDTMEHDKFRSHSLPGLSCVKAPPAPA